MSITATGDAAFLLRARLTIGSIGDGVAPRQSPAKMPRGRSSGGFLLHVSFLVALALAQAPPAVDPEARIVEYLKTNVKPGQRVVVSELYNSVFSAPDERVALNRLFNTFFK